MDGNLNGGVRRAVCMALGRKRNIESVYKLRTERDNRPFLTRLASKYFDIYKIPKTKTKKQIEIQIQMQVHILVHIHVHVHVHIHIHIHIHVILLFSSPYLFVSLLSGVNSRLRTHLSSSLFCALFGLSVPFSFCSFVVFSACFLSLFLLPMSMSYSRLEHGRPRTTSVSSTCVRDSVCKCSVGRDWSVVSSEDMFCRALQRRHL